jgi:hypothetical protein
MEKIIIKNRHIIKQKKIVQFIYVYMYTFSYMSIHFPCEYVKDSLLCDWQTAEVSDVILRLSFPLNYKHYIVSKTQKIMTYLYSI